MLKVKISFCVFFILSAYTENTRKVFKHLWRMCGKYLSVFGDYTKVFKRIWRKWHIGVICGTQNHLRICGKYLNVFGECAERIYVYVHGEDAKRLLTYSPNTPKDIKVCLSWLIIIRILIFLDSFYLHYMERIKPKNLGTVPLNSLLCSPV